MKRIVVLISGSGNNLQALINYCSKHSVANISAVISNRPDAFGLVRAEKAGIARQVIDHTHFRQRHEFDRVLQQAIDEYSPDVVILAGFMRVLTEPFVQHYYGRLLNIHPSLLPKYRGLHTHARALKAGDHEHGATVHFVTPQLDGGPGILQACVPILADDDEQSLAARVLTRECVIYPQVLDWFVTERLILQDDQVKLDSQVLLRPKRLEWEATLDNA